MNLYFIYLLILILTILFFLLIKDKIIALKLTGILTISSAILLTIISFIIKYLLNSSITMINISNITKYIFIKFISTSIVLLVLGVAEIFISQYVYAKDKKENSK